MPTHVINAVAPTRICDVGGWTDTHFAVRGKVFNVAISPYVEVQISSAPMNAQGARILLSAENYNEAYPLTPGHIVYGKHPLMEAALDVMALPEDVSIRVNIYSTAPPGASMGTSAAVSVALIGALDALTLGRLSPTEVARLAHALETEKLGLECGIQDQYASALGGINLLHMSPYPHADVQPVQLPEAVRWELEQRLLLIYIGKPHNSSETHKKVIAGMGAAPENDARLEALRELADEAAVACAAGNFAALGEVFNRNTEVQRNLHPDLVCDSFEQIISVARSFGALGCKVNGAGGDGGSIAVLTSADMFRKRKMEQALQQCGFQSLPVHLAPHGLRVWRTPSDHRNPG